MLESTDTLWRFMKLSTLLMLLEKGKVWFPSVKALQEKDPFEGSLIDSHHVLLWGELCKQNIEQETEQWITKTLSESHRRMIQNDVNDLSLKSRILTQAFTDAIASNRAAWCWFRSDIESAAMWSIYGHQGIALRTSREKIRRCLPQQKEFKFEEMNYVDRRSCSSMNLVGTLHLNSDLLLRPHLLKAVEYDYEKELRIVTRCPNGAPGIMVTNLNALDLVEEVIVSPLLPEAEVEAIQKSIQRIVPDLSIKRSSLAGNNYPYGMAQRIEEVLHGYNDEAIEMDALPTFLRNL